MPSVAVRHCVSEEKRLSLTAPKQVSCQLLSGTYTTFELRRKQETGRNLPEMRLIVNRVSFLERLDLAA